MTSDALMSSVAAAVAGQIAQAAVQGGKGACAALVRLVRARFGHDKQALAALETADRDPGNPTALADLTVALERLVAGDAEFAAQMWELWPQAAAEVSAGEGSVINSVTGTLRGHLMQARDIRVEGGLHFGDTRQ